MTNVISYCIQRGGLCACIDEYTEPSTLKHLTMKGYYCTMCMLNYSVIVLVLQGNCAGIVLRRHMDDLFMSMMPCVLGLFYYIILIIILIADGLYSSFQSQEV